MVLSAWRLMWRYLTRWYSELMRCHRKSARWKRLKTMPANAELWGAEPIGGASRTNAVLGVAVPPAPTFDQGENDERD